MWRLLGRAKEGDNQIDRDRVLEVRIHSPPAESQQTFCSEIIDIAFSARPATISFEAANPRHAREWSLFERVKLPKGKIIKPSRIAL